MIASFLELSPSFFFWEITLLSVNVTGHWFFGCNDRKGFYGGLPILPFRDYSVERECHRSLVLRVQ